ncbi:MAG TPA: FAD binding domain-containing protein [Candidatus Sulfomarinibacteraceae bacterium]|nr:FAD binding domain-containing protein [Candidatus Sulfomarinibacteraceae bacterium]
MLPAFRYARPSALREALDLLGDGHAHVHSGGTDLLGCLRDEVFDAETVVSLGAVPDLTGIARTSDGGLRIGAMTTIAEIAADATVRERYSALADAASVVASPQLRNQGTLGGNLCQKPRCWYYRGPFDCLRKGGEICFAYDGDNRYHCLFGGDMCYIVHPSDPAPALAALGAVCRVSGASASRSVAVDKLHVPPSEDPRRETVLEPDEIITDIVLPAPAAGLRSSYRKVRARAAWDFALAGLALALVFDGDTVSSARVFLSGAAPVPWRATGVEDAVTGTALGDDAIAAAAEAAVAGAEPLAMNGYKVDLFKGLVADQLEAIRG